MNGPDSSGFKLEFERTNPYIVSLIKIPRRNLCRRIVHPGGPGSEIIGFVDQEGNSRFMSLSTDATLIAAYANLDQAVRAVRFAEFIRVVSGICCGLDVSGIRALGENQRSGLHK
jgi:hypothetical protein